MRAIIILHPPNLPARWVALSAQGLKGLYAKKTHKQRSKYLRANGHWTFLKTWLSDASGGKCWYCEAKLGRAPLDVDHFRPKLKITVDGVKLGEDSGYYWLAYEWSNFRISCQRCNRPETDEEKTVRGKANEFPLRDETTRCLSVSGILTDEEPRFLDPYESADCELLAHPVDGEVRPTSEKGTWEFERADYTIKKLGFNAFNAPEEKRHDWRILDDLISLAGNQPAVVDRIQERLSPEHEYSSFFRSSIGTHRDKPWIEALL